MIDPATRGSKADEIFSDRATYKRFLDVEVALAEAEADLGLIPREAAEAIRSWSDGATLNLDRLNADFEKVGFPIVGLVRLIVESVPGGFGEYVHWGATTQDIMDTGVVLGLKHVVAHIQQSLTTITGQFSDLSREHRETLIAGRSQLQHAVPVTFGYKVAGWVHALDRHQERLAELSPRLLQVQFGGAVGTLVAVHPHGPAVRTNLAKNLGLGDPGVTWHTHRESMGEFVTFLGLLTGTLAKIATDVVLLAQTEVGEVNEPLAKGRGTSSAMPQKRNPVLSQQILVATRAMHGIVSMMLDAMVQDHERGTGTWQSEWTLVPDACRYSLAALDRMEELSAGLVVDAERMETNIGLSKQFVYAEAVMMALADKLGRQKAHDLVDEAVDKASGGVSFQDALLEIAEIGSVLAPADLDEIFSGKLHRAAGQAATDQALAKRRSE